MVKDLPKIEEIEEFRCKQMHCHYNADGYCDATIEWADEINDTIEMHQMDYPEEDVMTIDEAKAEIIPEEPSEDNCELFQEDKEKCPLCGGELEGDTVYEKEEFWGAMVERPIYMVKCSECGEEV